MQNRAASTRNILKKATFLAVFLAWLGLGLADAHQVTAASAKAIFERDGNYLIELSLDITPSEDPAANDEISPEQAALEYLQGSVALKFDEEEFEPDFGDLQEAEIAAKQGVTRLYTEVKGTVPAGTKQFFLHVLPTAQVAVVMVVFKDGVQGRRAHVMLPGEFSKPIDLQFVGEKVIRGDPFAEPPTIYQSVRVGAQQLVAGMGQRAVLVLAILLFAVSIGQSAQQCLTLMLGSLFGHVLMMSINIQPKIEMLEFLLGLCVVAIAIDNFRRERWSWKRLLFLAVIGVIVGACTRDVDHERNLTSLLGFYAGGGIVIGVMLGLFWAVFGFLWKMPWYRNQLVVPGSFLVAGIGAFWTLKAVIDFFVAAPVGS